MHARIGDWSYLLQLKDKRQAVTPDDIKRVLDDYFTEDNRTVAYLVKPEKEMTQLEATRLQRVKSVEVKAK